MPSAPKSSVHTGYPTNRELDMAHITTNPPKRLWLIFMAFAAVSDTAIMTTLKSVGVSSSAPALFISSTEKSVNTLCMHMHGTEIFTSSFMTKLLCSFFIRPVLPIM